MERMFLIPQEEQTAMKSPASRSTDEMRLSLWQWEHLNIDASRLILGRLNFDALFIAFKPDLEVLKKISLA
jgi:hypothetical protein